MAQKLFDKASLVMIPSQYKEGKIYNIKPEDQSSSFEFERGSAATRVNSDGLIETLHDEATNLLLQSNNFDTSPWTGGSTIFTSGQSGYDGSNDAWLLTHPLSTNSTYQSNTNSGVQTFSIYAKSDGSTGIRLYAFGDANANAYFDLNNGVVRGPSNVINSDIVSVGNGWYRCSITFNQTNTTLRIYTTNNVTTPAAGSVYIQDAQLESGAFATPYIETTTEAVTRPNRHDTPRLDYSGSEPALLLEPQRSNLLPQSENLNDTSHWDKVNVSFSANEGVSPEGETNAVKVVPNAFGSAYWYDDIALTSGETYVLSFYAKSDGWDYLQVTNSSGISGSEAQNFDLINGTSSGNYATGDAVIEEFGNGWYRIIVKGVASSTSGRMVIGLASDLSMSRLGLVTPSGSNGVLLYGFQIEQGSYATSYIPTNGQAETRLADVCQGGGDASVFNDSEGTLYFEGSFSENGRLEITDGTGSDNVVIGFSANPFMRVRANNVTDIQIFGSGALNEVFKIAVKYKSEQTSFYINGTEVGSSTATFSFLNSLNECRLENGSVILYGGLRALYYFPEALTDTELQQLTTI